MPHVADPQHATPATVPLRPSPTTGLLVLLVCGLLATAALFGRIIFALYDAERITPCVRIPLSRPYCRSVYADLVGYEVTATVVGAVVIVAMVAAVPTIQRRRRHLMPPGAAFEAMVRHVGELAASEGLRRAPEVLIGGARQRDAVTLGRPGRYVLAIPPMLAARWRHPELFDPVVRHELAHIKHHDVALTWLAVHAGRLLTPIFAVLVAVFGYATVRDPGGPLTDLLWRATLLWAGISLLRARAIRAREHDADLAAARAHPRAMYLAVSGLAPDTRPWWARLRARHPGPAARSAVLTDATAALAPSAVDAFAAGFLAALVFAIADTALQTALSVHGLVSFELHHARPATAALSLAMGACLGLAVGLARWRGAAVDARTGRHSRHLLVVLSTGAGLALGQISAYTWSGFNGWTDAWLPGYTFLLGAGCAVLSGDLAWLLTGTDRRRVSWLLAAVTNTVIFGYALVRPDWQRQNLGLGLTASPALALLVRLGGARWFTLALLLVVVVPVAALLSTGRRRRAADSGQAAPCDAGLRGTVPWVLAGGVLAGLVAAAVFLVPASWISADDAGEVAWWSAVIAGISAWVVRAVVLPYAGAAIGLIAGATASLTVDVTVVVYLVAYGALSSPVTSFLWTSTQLTVFTTVEVAVLLAPLAPLLSRQAARSTPRHPLLWLPMLLSAAGTAALVAYVVGGSGTFGSGR